MPALALCPSPVLPYTSCERLIPFSSLAHPPPQNSLLHGRNLLNLPWDCRTCINTYCNRLCWRHAQILSTFQNLMAAPAALQTVSMRHVAILQVFRAEHPQQVRGDVSGVSCMAMHEGFRMKL